MSNLLIQVILGASALLGNLYKFSFFSQDVRISLLDVYIFVFIVFIPLGNLKKYQYFIKPISIFFIIALFSLVLAIPNFGFSAVIVGGMYLARWVAYSLTFTSFVQYIKAPQLKRLIYVLAATLVLGGVLQYAIWPDIRHLAVAEWDPHFFRVVGSLLDPGFMGIMLVFILIFFTLNPLRHKLSHLIAWSLSYLTFALTYSRSSYLAFLAGMAYISWKQKGWKFLLKILLLFTVTVTLLPRSPDGEGVKLERTSSIEARITNWKNSWQIFIDYPLSGVGFNVYRYAQNKYGYLGETNWLKSHAGAGVDSSLLFVAATTGIMGLAAYLWYLKRLWSISYVLKATMIALLVHSLFLNSLFYPFVMIWLALLTAWSLQLTPDESGSQSDPLPQTQVRSRLHSG